MAHAVVLPYSTRALSIARCPQVIYTNTSIKKPAGILWHKLSPEKLAQIRVLQQLKERIEAETGQRLPTGELLGLQSLATALSCVPCPERPDLAMA
jgi:hypothetical protein